MFLFMLLFAPIVVGLFTFVLVPKAVEVKGSIEYKRVISIARSKRNYKENDKELSDPSFLKDALRERQELQESLHQQWDDQYKVLLGEPTQDEVRVQKEIDLTEDEITYRDDYGNAELEEELISLQSKLRKVRQKKLELYG